MPSILLLLEKSQFDNVLVLLHVPKTMKRWSVGCSDNHRWDCCEISRYAWPNGMAV